MFFILPSQHSSNSCLFIFKFWFLLNSPIYPLRALLFGIRAWILGTSLLEYKIMGSENQNISSLRPFFDGSDYPHWKFKIELYLDYDSIKLWDIIRKGWQPPKATVNGVEQKLKEIIRMPFNKKEITKINRLWLL